MKQNKALGTVLLTVTMLIWGFAFIAQDTVAEYIGAFYINAIRFIIGGIVLIPALIYAVKTEKKKGNPIYWKKTIIASIICGSCLAISANIQQFGIALTTPGKAGFLTAMYIVFIPIATFIIFRKKLSHLQIIGIVAAVVGVGLLSLNENFTMNGGDALCLLCALTFTAQIMFLEYFSKKYNPIIISCISFFVVGILSFCFAIPLEEISTQALKDGLWQLLFLGIFSSGIAYTLQAVGTKHLSGTPASLIMSLESVTALIAGWIILGDSLSIKEIFGCIIMFTGVILVQVFEKPSEIKLEKTENE